MIYITFNDQYTGVYKSQVLDVLEYLQVISKKDFRLISFLPRTNFFKNKELIKSQYHGKIHFIPIFSLRLWRVNKLILFFLLRLIPNQSIICRGPLATSLALFAKRDNQKVCFDARGATKAEILEYDMGLNLRLIKEFINAELDSVLKSEFRIAVSEKLVDYWRIHFGYDATTHIVIPCTVSSKMAINKSKGISRKQLEFEDKDIVLVFSGGIQGWQSLSNLSSWLENLIASNERIKLLFLSQSNKTISLIQSKFGAARVKQLWLSPEKVIDVLCLCDFGILVRELNDTNLVASPTKLAEYFLAGLPVIISNNIGDYSELVKKNNLGYVLGEDHNLEFPLSKWPKIQKERVKLFAQDNLSKESKIITNKYLKLINALL